jgi:hypothetical protein
LETRQLIIVDFKKIIDGFAKVDLLYLIPPIIVIVSEKALIREAQER